MAATMNLMSADFARKSSHPIMTGGKPPQVSAWPNSYQIITPSVLTKTGYKKRRIQKDGERKKDMDKPDTVANILGITDFGPGEAKTKENMKVVR